MKTQNKLCALNYDLDIFSNDGTAVILIKCLHAEYWSDLSIGVGIFIFGNSYVTGLLSK